MSRDDPSIRLRVPEDLKERIAEAARQSRRSMNAEIVFALDRAFPAPISGEAQPTNS